MSFLFPSSTITLEAALRDLAGGSPKARALAAHALGDIEDPTERRRAVEALLVALDDDRAEVRAEACASLGDLRDASALPKLVKRLDDGIPVVRQNAAIALGTLGSEDGFAPLAVALREGPADLRFQAATSLAEIAPDRAYAPLLQALDDTDPQVVSAAALSLGAIGNRAAIDVLVAHLENRDSAARFDVAYALAELGDARGSEFLVAGLDDAERAWDAVAALAMLRDVGSLKKAVTMKKIAPEAQMLAAGSVLVLEPEDLKAREVLVGGLSARKVHVRGLAVEQLGKAGGDWAKIPLEKLARSGKGRELLEPIAAALRQLDERIRLRGDRIGSDG